VVVVVLVVLLVVVVVLLPLPLQLTTLLVPLLVLLPLTRRHATCRMSTIQDAYTRLCQSSQKSLWKSSIIITDGAAVTSEGDSVWAALTPALAAADGTGVLLLRYGRQESTESALITWLGPGASSEAKAKAQHDAKALASALGALLAPAARSAAAAVAAGLWRCSQPTPPRPARPPARPPGPPARPPARRTARCC